MVHIKARSKEGRKTFLVWLIRAAVVGTIGWFLVSRVYAPIAKAKSDSSSSTSSLRASGAPPPASSPISVSLISRHGVKVTTDVRGNLGPPEVMVQETPGTDWLKDRWQAASDMHGTAIPGVHWVVLEFPSVVTTCTKLVLDWEAAFARDYRIEVSNSNQEDEWTVLFDSHVDSDRRSSEELGTSPGVKKKTPLHIVHTVTMPDEVPSFRYLRVYIRKSAMGWGVSLWELDVFGIME